jgi:hypothetical protein
MFSEYSIILQGKDEKCTLKYSINDHKSAQVWAGLMKECDSTSLRESLDPWQNFHIIDINQKILQLEELIDRLNEWLPNDEKILRKWNYDDHKESVNRLHVHFPEQEKTITDPTKKNQLTKYNDLIHEIEELTFRPNEQRPYLLICPDGIEDIPLTDFLNFSAKRFFGELCLHYCHVGRHPFELYSAGDVDCPIDQIIPQHSINTYHTLRFYDDSCLEQWHMQKFKFFYDQSTIKNKFKFNDPRLTFGYISLGSLKSVNNLTEYNKDELVKLVKHCNTIISWSVT